MLLRKGVEKPIQVDHLAEIESRGLLPLEKGQKMLSYSRAPINRRQKKIYAWDLGTQDLLKTD